MKKMKEKSNGRDRNEKVEIAQSNNSIFGGLSLCDDNVDESSLSDASYTLGCVASTTWSNVVVPWERMEFNAGERVRR